MASTSASSFQKIFKYDVFLSFRGEDTRKNFVDHLYHALQQKSVETYKDDKKITKGKTINDELIQAIEDSKFYIIVFSKNYASSSWCLDELVNIMECQKMSERTAYPVFLDVEPSEVRKQNGVVESAFAKHVNDKSAGKWREALKEAADLAGWELKNIFDGHEAKLVQKIVEEISLELRFINMGVDENFIGMKTRINDVVSTLELGVDDVRMIGIKGMGGAGKTTLARAVYDHISFQFEGCSYVENVREESTPSMSGLKLLQKQVLSDVLSDQGISVSGILEGKSMLKKKMCGKKVLIVLDDVDKIEQLVALAGDCSWFKPGSRIMITTRDAQVLIAHKVNLIHDVHLLTDKEAMCLFSRHAFGREIPIEGYKELSEQVVRYAAGLPLTIRVLGSFLCGKDDLDWKDALERLKKIPLNETMKVLELSYIDLEDDYKEIFLDVACLLKGWKKDDAIRALESCGFHARSGLRVLEQKSLITISKQKILMNIFGQKSIYTRLEMHDHIEEMGKNIVRRLNPNESKRHSRLWINEEIVDILANDSGTKATKCITMARKGWNFKILMKGLANMKELRFLHVDDPHVSEYTLSKRNFDEVSLHLPDALRFLSWNYYPFSSLPKTFQAKNLVGLVMEDSKLVQLRKDGEKKACLKLRFLKFTYSKLRTLDLSVAPNLETLILQKCFNLVKVHFQVTPNLKELGIYDCNRLKKLHMPVECLKLVNLGLKNLNLRTLHLGITPNLETLILENCHNLVEVHFQVTPNLKELRIYDCYRLKKLHLPAESPKLRSLDLNDSELRNLDLGITPNLETLILNLCTDMVELHITAECPKLVTLHLNDSAKLRTLDLGLTPNLESLNLQCCYDLEEINAPAECLKKLLDLDISHCGRFESFEFDKELDSPEVVSLSELHLIADDKGICETGNTWPRFQFSCYYEEDPASSFGNIEKLISLGFGACINVDSFSDIICGLQCLRKLTLEGGIPEAPKNLDRLDCLEKLSLRSTDIKTLPDSICMLKHLKALELESCLLLEKLPVDIGRLQCLESLILSKCTHLQDFPNSICEMRRLKCLELTHCVQVEKLPEKIGRLECLKELNILASGISHLPHSLYGLRGLRIIGDRWLLESCGLTPKRRRMSDEDSDFDDEMVCDI